VFHAVIIAGIVEKRDQDLSRARLWRRGIDLEASIDACPQFKGRNLRRGPLLWLGPTAKGRAGIGRQSTGAHYNCAGFLLQPGIGVRV
jgi:hypothetical protein